MKVIEERSGYVNFGESMLFVISYLMTSRIACEVPFVEQRTELNEWAGG